MFTLALRGGLPVPLENDARATCERFPITQPTCLSGVPWNCRIVMSYMGTFPDVAFPDVTFTRKCLPMPVVRWPHSPPQTFLRALNYWRKFYFFAFIFAQARRTNPAACRNLEASPPSWTSWNAEHSWHEPKAQSQWIILNQGNNGSQHSPKRDSAFVVYSDQDKIWTPEFANKGIR